MFANWLSTALNCPLNVHAQNSNCNDNVIIDKQPNTHPHMHIKLHIIVLDLILDRRN